MTDGLKAQHRAAIIATLAANHRVEKAVLFGSRAMGAHTVTSDVDIALFGRQLTLTDQAKLAAACEELPMAQSVDLVLHSTIDNPALVEHICSHGVEWYRRGGGHECKWHEVGISAVATVTIGGTPSRKISEYWHGSISWATAKDVANAGSRYLHETQESITDVGLENSSAKVIPKGTIVITSRGTVGALVQLGKEMAFNQTCYAIQPGDGIDNDFLYYALIGTRPLLSSLTYGTIFQTITTKSFSEWRIPLPPLPEQKAIAHILGILDDKIELNRQMNETLEAMAKALFKSWFVDFDPVRAKAEGRSAGLPDEISALFPDSFEDSELGEIPRGWGIGTISELIDIDPARRLAKGSIAPYLEMKGVSTSGHTVTGVYPRKFTSGTKFQFGDTLLARITPCLENGKTALVDFLEEGEIGWGSTEFIVMCGKKSFHNSFVYCLARSEEFRSHAIRNMVGSSGRQRIPSNTLADFQVSLPPNSLVDRFSVLCKSLLEKISKASAESATLSSIRDTLLPKLISGEIRVGEAEKIMEVAT
ncbi:MAG: restriction endonuclease subunit S [Synechococcus sp. SB0668_bin_15]|nr:restriction endonuclease subunit S [Synechococcus sp. SB0668_bin_15]